MKRMSSSSVEAVR